MSEFLTREQLSLLRIVVAARNAHVPDVAAAVRASMKPAPSRAELDALIRVLDSEAVQHQPGESANSLIKRLRELLGQPADDEDDEHAPPADDRY